MINPNKYIHNCLNIIQKNKWTMKSHYPFKKLYYFISSIEIPKTLARPCPYSGSAL